MAKSRSMVGKLWKAPYKPGAGGHAGYHAALGITYHATLPAADIQGQTIVKYNEAGKELLADGTVKADFSAGDSKRAKDKARVASKRLVKAQERAAKEAMRKESIGFDFKALDNQLKIAEKVSHE